MGKFVFGMMQSLDGYVAGVEGELEPRLAAFLKRGPFGGAEHGEVCLWNDAVARRLCCWR
jgi:hypothetical protein